MTESDGAIPSQKCDPYAPGFEECESFLRGEAFTPTRAPARTHTCIHTTKRDTHFREAQIQSWEMCSSMHTCKAHKPNTPGKCFNMYTHTHTHTHTKQTSIFTPTSPAKYSWSLTIAVSSLSPSDSWCPSLSLVVFVLISYRCGCSVCECVCMCVCVFVRYQTVFEGFSFTNWLLSYSNSPWPMT